MPGYDALWEGLLLVEGKLYDVELCPLGLC